MTLLLYLGAGAGFVAIGALEPAFLYSWPIAAAYLLCVWVTPSLVRRVLR